MMKRWFISVLMSWIVSPVWATDAGGSIPSATSPVQASTTLSVMAWNIWGGQNQNSVYTINGSTARQRAIDVVKDSGVDVVCMTELYGSAATIAGALGFYYYTPAWNAKQAILSRYPLSNTGVLSGLSGDAFIHATVTLPDGHQVRVHTIHLMPSGNFHIAKIRGETASDAELISEDNKCKQMIDKLFNHSSFKADMARADQVPVVVAGDFNWVSHLDYSEETKAAGLHNGRVLAIPTSLALAELGFIDTYRACSPLPTEEKFLGYTWSTVDVDYKWNGTIFVPSPDPSTPEYQANMEYRGLFGRIDFIYSKGAIFTPQSSRIIAHHQSNTEKMFPYFPSDHAAVVTQFTLDPVIIPQTPTITFTNNSQTPVFNGHYRGSRQSIASYGIAYTTNDPSGSPRTFSYHIDLGPLPSTNHLQYESPLTDDQSVSYAWYYTTESSQDKVYSAIYTHTATVKNDLVLYLNGDGLIENKVTGEGAYPDPAIRGDVTPAYTIAPPGRGRAFDLNSTWWIDAGQPACVNKGSFTLGLWFNRQHNNTGSYCFFGTQSWRVGTNLGFSVQQEGLTSGWGGNSRQNIWPFFAKTDNLWQYLTVVVDRVANTITCYRDGSLVRTAPLRDSSPSSTDAYIADGMNLLFGRSGTGTGTEDDGNFPSNSYQDEIALWSRALSAEEVSTLYTTYKGVLVEPDPIIVSQEPSVKPDNSRTLIFHGFYYGSKQGVSHGIAYTTNDPAGEFTTFTHMDLGALPSTDHFQYESPFTNDQSVSYAWYYTTESSQDKVYSAIYTHTVALKKGLVLYLNGESLENKITGDGAYPNPVNEGNINPSSGTKYDPAYIIAPSGRGGAFDLNSTWWIDAGQPACVNKGSFTLGLWFNRQLNTTGSYCFFGTQSWRVGTNLGFSVHQEGLTSAWGGNSRQHIWPFFTKKDDLWQYLTMVVDRDANTLTCYRDGILVKIEPLRDSPPASTAYIANNMNLLFGRSGTGTGTANDGNYPSKSHQDEIALWSRALSAKEVQVLYTTYKGVLVKPDLSAIAYLADATHSQTWQTLNWDNNKQWVHDDANHAVISNLTESFDFNAEVAAASLWFHGNQFTTFTNNEKKALTASLWDFSGMTQPVTFKPSIATTTLQISNTQPFTLVGADAPAPPQTISATITGIGGVVVAGGTTLINVVGTQNAGGHYTVKTGATLKLGDNTDAHVSLGAFQANPTRMLTYSVESGATLEFTSDNIAGWGIYSQTTAFSRIAGTLKFSGALIHRVSGRYTIQDGAVFDNQMTDLTREGLIFTGSTYVIEDGATVTFKGKKFSCGRSSSRAYPTFIIGTGATMNVTAPGYSDKTITIKGTGRLNLTSLEKGSRFDNEDGTRSSLILDGAPTLSATGDMSTVTLNIAGTGATISLASRTTPLTFKNLTTSAGDKEIYLNMEGYAGTLSPTETKLTLLSWTGTKPANLTITPQGSLAGFAIIEEPNQIVAEHTITITLDSGEISPNVEDHLRKVMNQDITISAEDANNAYAFTLVPTVNEETGKATLDCSFKLTKFVLHTNNTRADITIEVVSTGSTTAPTLALGSKIDIVASANVSTGYISVGDKFSATTITSVAGNKERSSAIIANIPIDPSTPFFKASILIQ